MRSLTSHARSGFTLVEVLVALGILLFGMTAILGLFTFGAALSRSSHLRTIGASAVEATVADLEETLFPLDAEGEAGPPRVIRDREVPGYPGLVYSAQTVENPADRREYKVDVVVRWSSGGVEREKAFSTILLREVPFGERLRRRFIEHAGDPKPSAPAANSGAASGKAPEPKR